MRDRSNCYADNPAVNSVGIDAAGRACAVKGVYDGGAAQTWGTFAGISWYSPDALARIREDQFSIVSFWAEEAAAGRLPSTWTHDGQWYDVGTPLGPFMYTIS